MTREQLAGKILVWDEYPFTTELSKIASYRQRIKNTIKDFYKLYPNVKILFEFFEEGQARKRFITQVQRGAGANLLIASSNYELLELIKMGALQSLDDYNIDRSLFNPRALSQARYQNRLYGIPLYLSTQTLCYNKKKVEEPVNTLSALIQQARKGYSVGLVSGFRETFWGVGIFRNNQLDKTLNSQEMFESLQIHKQQFLTILQEGAWQRWMEWLKTAQAEPNFIVNHDEEALQEAFVQGKLAYLTCSSTWIPYAREILGTDTLGVALLPGEDNSPTPILRTGMFIFNRASSQQQIEISLKLAQFLTNRQQQIRLSSQEIFIPSNNRVAPNPALYPIQATLIKQAQSSLAFNLDDIEQLTAIADIGEQLYTQVLAGELSSEIASVQLQQLVINQP
ncbi:MAG: extracellular solute-binding protein [Xenococcus sp. (in: cyanobacteria)]